MKKKLFIFLLSIISVVCLTVGLTACGSGDSETETISVTSVMLDKSSLDLTVEESYTLSATVSPSSATNQNVTWSSSATSVATVSGGKVTAVSEGTAVITVTTSDGGYTATCSVTITEATSQTVSVTSVSLNYSTLSLEVGESSTLTATVLPNDAADKTVSWSSSDESVATVSNGVVTAVAAGTATITVTTADGNYSATCEVTVTETQEGSEEPTKVAVTGVTLDETTIALTVGDEYTLAATISPSDATNQNITWISTNENVISVENGKLTAISAGTAVVIVTTEDGGKIATCTVAVNEAPVAVVSVSLNTTSATLNVGDTYTLTATILPSDATNKNATWSSSNTSVATVSNGVITAVATGTATITVTTEDGNYTANCEVTVTNPIILVTSVSLNTNSLSLTVGGSSTLIATVLPSGATNQSVTWASSDSTVATISNGVVTAIAAGTATITVTTEDGNYTAECAVTVKEKTPTTVSVTSVTLDKTSLNLEIGDFYTLTATILPSNANNQNVTWATSDSAIATISNGKITAVSAGTATITVTTEDGGYNSSCTVTVPEPIISVTSVNLDNTILSLNTGESITLTATILPSNSTNKNITWSSSNTSVATVLNGTITAVAAGTATITVTTEDGNYTADCEVTITDPVISVTSVSLDYSALSLTVGDNATLIATVLPSNATNKNITWTSSNTNVAIVSDGKITAIGAGTAVIIVTTENEGKLATCTVTVKEATVSVTSVSLNNTSLTLEIGETSTLIATILPSNATNQSVTWSSSDTSVATVSNGTVVALSVGTTVIIVTTEDGGKIATCTITVKEATVSVSSVSLDYSAFSLDVGDVLTLTATVLPSNATNQNVYWTTSDSSIATVSDGTVTAVGEGTATITVTTTDGEYFATCIVTVTLKIAVTVYIDGIETYTTYTDRASGYKISLENPEDITTNSTSEVYFDGWYLDSSYTTEYSENTKFTQNSSVYAKMITVYISDFSFTVDNGEATITGFSNSTATVVVVPNYLNTFPVTTIGESVFKDKTMIRILIILDGIQSIDNNAFYNCNSMESIVLPDSIITIGNYAFYNCTTLSAISIPDNVTSLGSYIFSGITAEIIWGDDPQITEICDYAFANYYGNSLNIPNKIISIGNYAFYNCTALSTVSVPNSVTSIGSSAFNGCSSLVSITLPFVGSSASASNSKLFGYIFGTSNYDSSKAIPQYYSNSNYITYYIPTTLTTVMITGGNIPYGAFSFCSSLTSVTIGDSVTSIGVYAFRSCTSLTSINIPNSVTSIGSNAFYGCTHTSVYYSGTASEWASISFGDSTANPLYYADNLYLNDTLATDITLEGITTVNAYAFYGCTSLTSVTIGGSVTSIGRYAFYDCTSVVSITIPDSVTSIGRYAFYDCTSVVSITIPDSVTSIGSYAFYKCTALTEINFNATSMSALSSSNCVFYCAGQSGNGITVNIGANVTKIPAYLFYPYSSNGFAPKIVSVVFEDNSSCTSIGGYAFYNCTSLTSITIPDSVTSIGEYAFYNCTSLTSITIPDSVTSIGEYAFNGCTKLKSITIPDGVTTIGDYTFRNCTLLTSITIPDSVTSIGEYMFNGCTSLTSVTIGGNVTSIGSCAFYGCTLLTSVYYSGTASEWASISFDDSTANPLYYAGNLYLNDTLATDITLEGITTVNAYAFYGCTSLTSVTIGGSVTSIGSYAFYKCTSLTSVTIGGSVTSIGSYAFYKCTSLTSITIPDGVTSIGERAFCNCKALTEINFNATTMDDLSSSNYVFYCAGQSGDGITVTIGANVTKIPAYLFYPYSSNSCAPKITSIVFEEDSACKTIGSYAFYNCTSLTSITIPDSVISIGEYAFNGCTKLIGVYYGGTASEWSSVSIGSSNSPLTSATIYYYSEKDPDYTDGYNYWHYVDGEIVVWTKSN